MAKYFVMYNLICLESQLYQLFVIEHIGMAGKLLNCCYLVMRWEHFSSLCFMEILISIRSFSVINNRKYKCSICLINILWKLLINNLMNYLTNNLIFFLKIKILINLYSCKINTFNNYYIFNNSFISVI
jgi:hypothetical protein